MWTCSKRAALIDPARIGLSGLSDGSSTVQFALVNSHRFAVVSTTHCCMEPVGMASLLSGANIRHFQDEGYPTLASPNPEFWKPYSWTMNAQNLDVPILIQLPDHEYVTAMEAYAALMEHDKPVEMYVFPNEFHIKWQPAHRLAIYERNVGLVQLLAPGARGCEPGKAPAVRALACAHGAREEKPSEEKQLVRCRSLLRLRNAVSRLRSARCGSVIRKAATPCLLPECYRRSLRALLHCARFEIFASVRMCTASV
ncbi:MAG: prolyl oligopeptidase family serine peptidase [Gammaproteobacteria bacterium]